MEMKKFRKCAGIFIIAGINLLVLYALACTYLWARQSHFIFTPLREIKKTPSIYQLPYEDIYRQFEEFVGQKS